MKLGGSLIAGHYRRRVLPALALLALPSLAEAAGSCTGPSPRFDPARPITQAAPPAEANLERRRLLLAVTPECTAAAASAIERDGGIVEYRADAVGYLRFRLGAFPLDRVPGIPGVESAFVAPRYTEMVTTLMGDLPLRQRSARGPELPEESRRTFDATLPYDNPFTLAVGIGAERFMAADPRRDGRGVTVAVIDSGVDPAMPQLAEALDSDGRPVRKIADFRTSIDPRVEGSGSGWVSMTAGIVSATLDAEHEGQALRLPAPGRYRIGAFAENSPAAPVDLEGDLDGDGNPAGRDAPFLLLWDMEEGAVWVDTDRDLDFADERRLTDFARNGDIAFFRPARLSPERAGPVAFAVETSPERQAVALLMGTRHNAFSASSAVGSRYFGGAAGGVAPGARLVSISIGSGRGDADSESEAALYQGLEALLIALGDPQVDVVSYYPPSEWVRDDGRSVFERITRRAVRHYGKPVLAAANNGGPTINTLTHSGNEAISVGAYTARENVAATTGIDIDREGIIRSYSGRGPADDGAVGPSLVAPTGFVAAETSYAQPRRTSRVMAGYQLGGGTSQATPTAAGAVALLVGAARQAGLPHDHRRVEAALLSSARWIEGYGAHEQGAGLIDVPGAWEVLRRLTESPPDFTVAGPVATRSSALGLVPTTGRGLYEQEGWRPGQEGDRSLTFERVSGPRGRRRYTVELRGNDGTYSAAGEVELSRGRPVRFPVHIAPQGAGVHSALLRLIDPATRAVAHQTLLTVVAAEALPSDGGPLVRDVRLSYMRPRSLFVSVPENLRSITVRATMPRERAELGLRPPRPAAPRTGACTEAPVDAERVLFDCTVPAPVPGVWEIFADWPAELSPGGPSVPDGMREQEVRIEVEALAAQPTG